MFIAIPKEKQQDETRVAATPATTEQLRKLGFTVLVESGAGSSAADRLARRRGRLPRSSERTRLPGLHRDVGALLLLRHDGPAGPLHDQAIAASWTCRGGSRPRRGSPAVRGAGADVRPRLRLADLRLVQRPRLFHAASGRNDCRPVAGHARDGRARRAADERGPFGDELRCELPDCASAADRRVGVPEGQYFRAGRPALPGRGGDAANGRLHHLLRRDQHRRGAGPAGVRRRIW